MNMHRQPTGPILRKEDGGRGDDDLVKAFEAHDAAVKARLKEIEGMTGDARKDAQERLGEHGARLTEIEQKLARRRAGPDTDTRSIGREVADNQDVKALKSGWRGRLRIETKSTITSASASGGSMVPPDRRAPDLLPQRRLRVRDLVSPGTTTSGTIQYPRQNLRTNNAAVQANEGDQKPESAYGFELITEPVKTIAHWVPASNQILDDAPMLGSIIDGELRYGLADVEERQILNGSGTGANIAGIYTQAAVFTPVFTMEGGANHLDVLLLAIAQLDALGYEPDGIVLNGTDWARMQVLRDGEGNYIGGGPFSTEQVQRLWNLPYVTTGAMPIGKFLVGAFKRGAQIFDRQEATVEISTEHADFFTRNLVAIRAEERLAFAVYRPDAFVKDDFAAALAASTA